MQKIRKRARVSSLMALLGLAVAACDPDDQPESDFFVTEPYGVAACDEPTGALTGTLTLALYAYGSTKVAPLTRALASYYRRHGLTFTASESVQKVSTSYAINTNLDDLERAVAKAFPGVDLSDEGALANDPALNARVQVVVANEILRPMIEFAKTHGQSGTGVTSLVALPRAQRAGGTSLFEDEDASVAGLAVSPALIAAFKAGPADEGALWGVVDLPASFSPMMFLDTNVIAQAAKADPVLRDVIVAHEFGHTTGLIHRDEAGNLMAPSVAAGRNGCSDSLAPDQLAMMRTTLGLETAVQQPLRAPAPDSAVDDFARPEAARAFLARRFPAQQMHELLRGDRAALRDFVELLVHPMRLGRPAHRQRR